MLTLQQANEFLQGSPFSDMYLQQRLTEDSQSSYQLRTIVLDLYTGRKQLDSLQNLFEGFNEEFKGYALSIIANFLIYGENDILFINTAQGLLDSDKTLLKKPA